MVNSSTLKLDHVFGALQDSTRRSIVECLIFGEKTVKELAAPFDMSLPAISKHLRILERSGLIIRRDSGRNRICSLTPDALKTAAEWVNYHQTFWTQQLDALENYLNNAKENEE